MWDRSEVHHHPEDVRETPCPVKHTFRHIMVWAAFAAIFAIAWLVR